MKISIVTTLYRSAPYVKEFHRRAIEAARKITDDVELIMVNDGSPDDSLEAALQVQRSDPQVVVVDLSRNFGHYKAIMTGLAYASGDLVFLIDSDLEEQPEDLALFYERFRRGDCDVVYGVQQTRRGGLLERAGGTVFFALVDVLGDRPLPRNLVTSRLMSAAYVRELIRHRDREFVMSDLWAVTGFRQIPMVVAKLATSPSTYSIWRRIDLAVKHLTTSSTRLLYLVFYTGLLIFTTSIGVVIYFLLRYLTNGIGVSGFASQIISLWFLGGLITLILGILGIYMASILAETKRRPYTIVRSVHRSSNSSVGELMQPASLFDTEGQE
ncbi:glycosyl transferase [Bradyrhizobium centrolobii]|uniref:Glycosyl transferase n=1 Tax=Bradyrhizobium centrolobii TaxID=1505087 RepID=A0A176YB72_9BRAD|nr:glycosyltransferase family 2 protein [Bradyrhizobium centrolobii]OAF01336.1 glycosyl transferase [Bradyrhizobium centrolobii]